MFLQFQKLKRLQLPFFHSARLMNISIIVAFAKKNRLIGSEGKLLWKLPKDLKRFKSITMGHFCVVGFNTFSYLPPLPDRHLIVLSQKHKIDSSCHYYASSIHEAIDIAKSKKERELFCIGGEKTYTSFLPFADTLYITEVLGEYEGDAFFPMFDENDYNLISEERLENMIFKTYNRKHIN